MLQFSAANLCVQTPVDSLFFMFSPYSVYIMKQWKCPALNSELVNYRVSSFQTPLAHIKLKKGATDLLDWNEKTQQRNVDTIAIYFLNIRKMGLPQGK